MPENESLRQKRERDFQLRIIAALEKPKKSKLWATLNSAFFLWLVSLVLLTVGGSYVTAYQQCTKDALDEISIDVKIQREYVERQHHIGDIITHDSTIDAIRSDLAKPYSYYPEFKDYPTYVIREQYQRYKDRVIKSDNGSLGQTSSSSQPAKISTFYVMILRAKFPGIEDGTLPSSLNDRDVADLRTYLDYHEEHDLPNLSPFFLLFSGATPLKPSCGPSNLWSRALYGSQAKIVEGRVNEEWSRNPIFH